MKNEVIAEVIEHAEDHLKSISGGPWAVYVREDGKGPCRIRSFDVVEPVTEVYRQQDAAFIACSVTLIQHMISIIQYLQERRDER